MSLFAALLVSSVLYAEAPASPDLTIQAYVNGAINIGIWQWSDPYQNAVNNGALVEFGTSLKETVSYDFQMKGPNDADFADVSPSATAYAMQNVSKRLFYCWSLDTNYVGSATIRVRAKNSSGEVSDWVESDPLTATVRVTGTLICSDGTATAASPAKNFADGRIATIVDDFTNSGNNRYTGYLFDKPTRIKGIRYMARIDQTYNGAINRFRSSLFQIASDATFSDAQTIHTVASDYKDITRMTEVTFDEPVTCMAIRHYKTGVGGEQSAEIEYIPADPPYSPEVAVATSDITNFYPVVTWTMPEGVWSDCVLEYATQSAGPFTEIAGSAHKPTDGVTFVYTNAAAFVGVPFYYRVKATCSHPNFEDETFTSSTLTFTRARRLDRAWGAETVLLSGVSVLPDTNGVMTTENKMDHNLCFDGNTSTWVDQYSGKSTMLPVIGLKFASPAHVIAFGYICRSDNYCANRIRNAKFYAANDYPELTDRVVVAGNPTEYSQSTKFYYKACDTVLGSGASCYFLYGDGEFYGNVAEVMFFGWTNADVEEAGIVTAPGEVTFSRGTGAELILAWSRGGGAVTGYRVERRVRGTDDWATIGTTDADTLTFTDASVETTVYEYRVTTLGKDSAEATSEAFTYRYYVPSTGTGLSGVVMWPYSAKSSLPTQRANEVVRGPEVINLAWTADEPLADGVTEAVAHLAWQGKIVAPFDGVYTFTLETDAGGAVFIDESTVFNSWTGGTKSPSGKIVLTAGEHAIRIDYRTNASGTSRKCILSWGGPVESEVVPITQLIPAETPPSAKLGDFTVQVYGQTRASFVRSSSGGTVYKIRGAANQNLAALDAGINVTALLKPFVGSFKSQVELTSLAFGAAGLIFQNANGHYIICYVRIFNADNWYGVCRSDPTTGEYKNVVVQTKINGGGADKQYDIHMKRMGRDYTFYYRLHGATDWIEIGSWTDSEGEFDSGGYLGIATWGLGDGSMPVEVTAQNFKVKKINGLMLYIR